MRLWSSLSSLCCSVGSNGITAKGIKPLLAGLSANESITDVEFDMLLVAMLPTELAACKGTR